MTSAEDLSYHQTGAAASSMLNGGIGSQQPNGGLKRKKGRKPKSGGMPGGDGVGAFTNGASSGGGSGKRKSRESKFLLKKFLQF